LGQQLGQITKSVFVCMDNRHRPVCMDDSQLEFEGEVDAVNEGQVQAIHGKNLGLFADQKVKTQIRWFATVHEVGTDVRSLAMVAAPSTVRPRQSFCLSE
jgi:hypothetical protein